MKTKKLLVVVLLCSLSVVLNSCSGIKQEGQITYIGYHGEKSLVPYQISNNITEFRGKCSKEDFDKIVRITFYEARTGCVDPMTFEPIKISIYYEGNIVHTTLYFSAKNGSGVPEKLKMSCDFKAATLINKIGPLTGD